jgi:phosphoinositide-3-kinase, regulatory subunit 4
MQMLQEVQNPRHFGPLTTVCIDRDRCWILVGTSAGYLSLWDRRFGLLLKSWRVGGPAGPRSPRITHCMVHPTKGRGKWVIVSLETVSSTGATSKRIIEIWDIESVTVVEQFVSRASSSQPVEPMPEPSPPPNTHDDVSEALASLVRSYQSDRRSAQYRPLASPSANVLSLAVGSDFGGSSGGHSHLGDRSERGHKHAGYMITGSEDCRLRFWDLNAPDASTVLSDVDTGHERPAYR